MIIQRDKIKWIFQIQPKDDISRYLFIVSDGNKWIEMLEDSQYRFITLDNMFTADKMCDLWCDLFGHAKTQDLLVNDFKFVLCSTRDDNLTMQETCKNLKFKFLIGWQLLKDLPPDCSEDTRYIFEQRIRGFIGAFETQREEALRSTDLHQFHLLDQNGNPRAPFDYAIAEDIKKKYDLIVVDGLPYLYDSGAYKADPSGTAIKRIVKGYLLPKFIKSRAINAIYTLLVEDADLQRSNSQVNLYPDTWICFQDCMLDAADMKPHAHSPQYFCINQIPHKWRDILDSAEGKAFPGFFDFAVPDRVNQKMFLEYAGLCLTKDARWQRILLVTGPGGTGKSLLLSLIGDAVGEENCAAVSMQGLQQRFSTSMLFGKTLNICADLPNEALTDSGVIKQLSGNDYKITAERKGEQAFQFHSYAKQVYSCNALPLMQGERNNAIFRRLLILEMNNVPSVPDPGLYDKLRGDLFVFMKLSIEMLHQMYADGEVCESDSSKKAVRRLMKDSDTVSAWVDECCELDKKARVERTVLYDSYSDYCSEEDRQSLSRTRFFAVLRSRGLQEIKSNGTRSFAGIKIKGQVSGENCPEAAPGVPQNCPEKDFFSVDDGQVSVPFDKEGQK